MGFRFALRICWILVLSSILPLIGCAKNPVTGGRQLALISESQELAIGQASHPEVLAEFGAVDNPALQEYFSRIGLQELSRLNRIDPDQKLIAGTAVKMIRLGR